MSTPPAPAPVTSTPEATTPAIAKPMDFTKLFASLPLIAASPMGTQTKSDDHKFWKTQPVPQQAKLPEAIGPVETKTLEQVRKDPLKLPEGYEWGLLDWEKEEDVEEAYVLLRDNYVEDDDAMFRFDYSRGFLRWALMPPEWRKDWQVAVRKTASKKLLAMITGTFAEVAVCGVDMPMAEINFLCIHKELRDRRLAPVLIKEVTRRVNLCNIWQAVYTAGVNIPTPVTVAKYWHRSLNPRKLIDVGFTSLNARQTIQRLQKLLQLPEQVETPGWRPLRAEDMPQVYPLLTAYLKQFKMHVAFRESELEHWFVPRKEVISCFVVENKQGKITDFASFYHLYSSIIRNPKHKTLRAAYSYYNAPGSLTLEQLTRNLLIEAVREDCDVFNMLDLMNNSPVFENLKFGIGDGNLHYYLYNYTMGTGTMSKDIGVVLM